MDSDDEDKDEEDVADNEDPSGLPQANLRMTKEVMKLACHFRVTIPGAYLIRV